MADRTPWQGLATVGSLGFTLVASTFLGLLLGYNLDRWLETSPLLTILCLLLGIFAGFFNIFSAVYRMRSARRAADD
ncbi:MAG: AtpZ/AtpI family protein [Lentisphaerae bacterium]|nr:AtpZ/AtpI family protein [Lentisphaerota bacterium]